MEGFDVIGDVHGMADKLHRLLSNLDYQNKNGVWRHPSRQAVFIGDLIDNGTQSIATLSTVRAMVEAGSARAVMGNHELNAVGWAMRQSRTGEYLREHNDTNYAHHQAFLDSIPDPAERQPWLDWFKTLPLYLDFGDVRFIHACWHTPSFEAIRPYLDASNCLRADAWETAFEKGSVAFEAVENLLKGIEINLPDGLSFYDHKGKQRWTCRISWWLEHADTLADMVHIPQTSSNPHNAATVSALANIPANEDLLAQSCYRGQCPVFFGHYWLKAPPQILSPKAACTDYSAGSNGPLVAYRWSGEQILSDENWVTSEA